MSERRSFSAGEARSLLRRARTGMLASLNADDGTPYASLVNVATDVRGWPVILVSSLAWHTRNLLADPRGSIMVAELPEQGDALTGPRVSIMGRFAQVPAEAVSRRFLARHPAAELYAGFGDFAFWRLEPERAHAVAGFGRIETIPADEMFPSADEMLALEEGAVAHMNADHDDAIQRYAEKLLGATPGGWKIVGVDPDGADLRRGENVLRLPFATPVYSGGGAARAVGAAGRADQRLGHLLRK